MACLVAETAPVDPRARLAEDVEIGPGCFIGPDVVIGRGTRLLGQVCLLGVVVIGELKTIGPYVAIGSEPQDYSYWDPATRVEIGDHNIIGERVTIHRASKRRTASPASAIPNHLLPGRHTSLTTASLPMELGGISRNARRSCPRCVRCRHLGESGRPSVCDCRDRVLCRRSVEDHPRRSLLHAS